MYSAVQELFEKYESAHTVITLVVTSLRQLEAFYASMGSIATMLDEAAVVTGEAAAQLRRLGDKANQDPAELQRAEERLSQWHGLARKHRVAADELPAHWASLTEALERLDNPEKQRDQLCKQRDEAERTCQDLTGRISKRRASSAHRLGEEITEAMQNLGMPGGHCEIALLPIRPGPMSRSGAESAEFRVSANAGQPVQSLTKIASGGELSRISLAIQVILASDASVPTIVFDEVDIGIGGTVANTIGEQLHQLGKTCQVICVTHLPQVAARADWQYAVTKSNSDRGIEVSWDLLAHEQRVREVARMSGSARPTAESLAHAEQMLHLGAESGGK